MQPYEIILKKRNGVALSESEIHWFVDAFTNNTGVTDYQAAAFLMAVFFRGMSKAELDYWTQAMLHSGEVLDLSDIPGRKIDKHSTGGVGDTVSITLAPLVAAAGLPVPMISGRGLGHTGGTLDKLESIPGFRTDLSILDFRRQVSELGCALIGQTGEIAPADKKLYALRDVTATVDCIPLIASSIMSKKLAEGIDGLVLDVKVGRGAFMKELNQARELARTLIGIGEAMGKDIVARLTAMDQPLGQHVGNALEIIKAVNALKGEGPEDYLDLVLTLGAEMLVLGGVEDDLQVATNRLQRLLNDGTAFEKFKQIVARQGGDPAAVDDLSLLPTAAHSVDVLAPESGVIEQLDAFEIGQAARMLGAGRQSMIESIDPGAGLFLHRKIGDPVDRGDRIATLYAARESLFEGATARYLGALKIGGGLVKHSPLLIDRIDHS